jgi:REP element-mobilizing transposase RayT
MDYTEAISRINPEDLVFVEVFGQKPSVRRELWGGEFWTDGYYVATVGEKGNWKTNEIWLL